jgi:hypothetical protein
MTAVQCYTFLIRVLDSLRVSRALVVALWVSRVTAVWKLEQMTSARASDNKQKSVEQYPRYHNARISNSNNVFTRKNNSKTTSRLLCACSGMSNFICGDGRINAV